MSDCDFLGAQADFSTVWNLADVLMGFMAIENILVIFLLGGIACKVLKDYTRQKKQGLDPVFKAKDVGLDNTDFGNKIRGCEFFHFPVFYLSFILNR